jgi:hypothetical protein
MKQSIRVLAALITIIMFTAWTPPLWAYEDDLTSPLHNDNSTPIGVDGVALRPMGIAAIIVGTATFLATLPFTAATGSVGQAADQLVAAPYRFTFERPLGAPTNYETWGRVSP